MTETLAAALAAVQAELPRVTKDETAEVQTRQGGTYSYSYADLADVSAAVMPLLGKHGLSFMAKPTLVEGRLALSYSLLHVSGEREDGVYPIRADGTPQAVGGEITYARRYCLCAVTGVAPENDDDDAAQASQRPATRQRQETQQPPTNKPEDTDWTWVEQFEERVKAAQSPDDVRAMKREAREQFKAGKVQPGQVNELMKLCDQQISALEVA